MPAEKTKYLMSYRVNIIILQMLHKVRYITADKYPIYQSKYKNAEMREMHI